MVQKRVEKDVGVDELVELAEVDRPVGHCVVVPHVVRQQLDL
jgi:hypothetical protein